MAAAASKPQRLPATAATPGAGEGDRTSVEEADPTSAEAADRMPGVAEVDLTLAAEAAVTQVVEVTMEVADTPEVVVAIQAVAADTAAVITADRFPASSQKNERQVFKPAALCLHRNQSLDYLKIPLPRISSSRCVL
jgi:hypothetical protein